MDRSRGVLSCSLAFLILPLVCSAQSRLWNSDAPTYNVAPTVSAHELKIPEKARQAYLKGSQRLAAKDAAGSIQEFQRAIKAFPDFYEAYYKIGIAHLEMLHAEDAEAAFQKSIELSDSRYAPPYFGLGLTLCNQKQLPEAEVSIRTGLDINPEDAAGHFTLAWVLYTAARLPEAEKSARQVIAYTPKFAVAYLLLGQIHMQQNNPAALVEDLDAYLQLDPDGPRSEGLRTVRAQAQHVLAQQSSGVIVAETKH